MMVMTMNLDQEPIPLDSRLWIFFSVFINNVFCHALDVYVINGYHLEVERPSPLISELDDSRVGYVLAMAPLSAYIMNRKNQLHLLFQSVML